MNQNNLTEMPLVLIVDDAPLMIILLKKMLQAKGYQILEAHNGKQALEMAINLAPRCILLDLFLPELNGLEVMKILKKQGLNIPIIFITGDTQKVTRQKCLLLGAIAVINKPPKYDELEAALNIALNQY